MPYLISRSLVGTKDSINVIRNLQKVRLIRIFIDELQKTTTSFMIDVLPTHTAIMGGLTVLVSYSLSFFLPVYFSAVDGRC